MPAKAFDNIEQFSHLEIIYYFDQVKKEKIVFSSHPRGNTNYSSMGVFAQRKRTGPIPLAFAQLNYWLIPGGQLL